MTPKQQQRLRKSCVAILGAKLVQRGEFDRACDQVLKPVLERFATEAIYLGLLLNWSLGKPRSTPALKLELAFKDQPRRIEAALVADGARLQWLLEGSAVLPHWRPRMRTLKDDEVIEGLLQLLALLEPPVADAQPVPIETDAGPRRTRRAAKAA